MAFIFQTGNLMATKVVKLTDDEADIFALKAKAVFNQDPHRVKEFTERNL